jgi:hypothetical protein
MHNLFDRTTRICVSMVNATAKLPLDLAGIARAQRPVSRSDGLLLEVNR